MRYVWMVLLLVSCAAPAEVSKKRYVMVDAGDTDRVMVVLVDELPTDPHDGGVWLTPDGFIWFFKEYWKVIGHLGFIQDPHLVELPDEGSGEL